MLSKENIELGLNEEVLEYIKSNLDKLPASYLLLKPYSPSTYQARIATADNGEIIVNLGTFYKPISNILTDETV